MKIEFVTYLYHLEIEIMVPIWYTGYMWQQITILE